MDKKNKDDKKNLVMGLAGAGALAKSKNMIIGRKTMFHGTSKENWDKIKKEGLRTDKGGYGGASEAYKAKEIINNRVKDSVSEGDRYIKGSKGYVHFTPRRAIANQYANVASGNLDYDLAGGKEMIDSSLRVKKGGKRVKMNVLYDNYKKSQFDNGLDSVSAFSKPEQVMLKHLHGSKTKIDVSPEEIVGSSAKMKDRINQTAKALPGYIKNNKVRFGAGIALAGGGSYLMGKAIKNKVNKMNKEAFDIVESAFDKIAYEEVWKSLK